MPQDSSWFPMPEGGTWTYRLANKQVIVRVGKVEKQAGVTATRIETLDKSDIVSVQHLAIVGDELRRVAHDGEKLEPPLVLLKLPPVKAQAWDVKSTMTTRSGADKIEGKCTTDEVDVKVPAGEYKKAVRVTADLTINGKKVAVVSWYADNVGLVKQRLGIDVATHEMELEKAELPK